MKTAHTPGPWAAHSNNEIHPLEDENGEYIIAEIPSDASQPKKEKAANAKLISAAPELLASVNELLKAFNDNSIYWPLPLTNCAVFDRAKNAIQKAI